MSPSLNDPVCLKDFIEFLYNTNADTLKSVWKAQNSEPKSLEDARDWLLKNTSSLSDLITCSKRVNVNVLRDFLVFNGKSIEGLASKKDYLEAILSMIEIPQIESNESNSCSNNDQNALSRLQPHQQSCSPIPNSTPSKSGIGSRSNIAQSSMVNIEDVDPFRRKASMQSSIITNQHNTSIPYSMSPVPMNQQPSNYPVGGALDTNNSQDDYCWPTRNQSQQNQPSFNTILNSTPSISDRRPSSSIGQSLLMNTQNLLRRCSLNTNQCNTSLQYSIPSGTTNVDSNIGRSSMMNTPNSYSGNCMRSSITDINQHNMSMQYSMSPGTTNVDSNIGRSSMMNTPNPYSGNCMRSSITDINQHNLSMQYSMPPGTTNQQPSNHLVGALNRSNSLGVVSNQLQQHQPSFSSMQNYEPLVIDFGQRSNVELPSTMNTLNPFGGNTRMQSSTNANLQNTSMQSLMPPGTKNQFS